MAKEEKKKKRGRRRREVFGKEGSREEGCNREESKRVGGVLQRRRSGGYG